MSRSTILLLVLGAVVAAPTTASAADVAERSVADPPKRLAEGRAFAVRDASRGTARRAVVRYYLSSDARRDAADVRLVGRRTLAQRGATRVRVPHSMPSGTFRLLACADDTGVVRERNERDNCAASRGAARVTDGSDPPVQAFSDRTLLADSDNLFLITAGLGRLACPTRVGGGQPGAGAALDRLHDLLARESRAGVRSFRRSRAFRTAAGSESGAAEALVAKSPAGTLQGLLRAHELEPREPRHLVNAAGMATSLGKPREALALLDRADTLDVGRTAPFGLNAQAVALNARGFALLQLGRMDQAEQALRAAMAIEPLLSEARINLGVARLCGGDRNHGMRVLRAGQFRQAKYDDTYDPEHPPKPVTGPSLPELMDVSAGKPGGLPGFPLPPTIDRAQAWTKAGLYSKMLEELRERQKRRGLVGAALPGVAQGSFASQIYGAVLGVPIDPDIVPVRAQLGAVAAEASKLSSFWWPTRADGFPKWQREAHEACLGTTELGCQKRELWDRCRGPSADAHASWLRLMGERVRATDAYLKKYVPRATGYAAHISDPVSHGRVMAQIESHVDAQLYSLTFNAMLWSGATAVCAEPEPGAPLPDGALPGVEASEKCPPWLRAVRLKLKYSFAEVEINCEKVKLEVSGKVGGSKDNWIGAFAEVEYATHTGKVTVFGGPKGSVKIPGTPFGGSIKDGIYIRFGSNGSVDDVGMRVKAEGAVSADPIQIKGGDSMDFSFVPVFGGG